MLATAGAAEEQRRKNSVSRQHSLCQKLKISTHPKKLPIQGRFLRCASAAPAVDVRRGESTYRRKCADDLHFVLYCSYLLTYRSRAEYLFRRAINGAADFGAGLPSVTISRFSSFLP